MQILGLQVGVTAQHTPILVPGDKRDFFDRQASLEQSARRLVSKVVEVQIFNLECLTGAAERGSHRLAMVRENASYPAG